MTGQSSTVVNFALSKDFDEPVRVKLHLLKGVLSSALLEKHHGTLSYHSKHKSYTDVLVKEKLKLLHSETELVVQIHVESGVGKQLCIPVTGGLRGHEEKSICHKVVKEGETTYIDDQLLVFETIDRELLQSDSEISVSSSYFQKQTGLDSQKSPFDEQWIELPIEYSKLPPEATLSFNIFSFNIQNGQRSIFYCGRLPLFESNFTLKSGVCEVTLSDPYPEEELNKRSDQAAANSIPRFRDNKPDWLAKLTASKLEEREEKLSRLDSGFVQKQKLIVELPYTDIPIVFSDIKYVPLNIPTHESSTSVVNYDPTFNRITYSNIGVDDLTKDEHKEYIHRNELFDPDMIRGELMEDPIEKKFRRLERMQHLSPLDKELKPTLRMRETLSKVMKKQFFQKMSAKERNIVWRYRWFILNSIIVGNPGQSNAVINFIKCVDWNNTIEVSEFKKILKSLQESKKLKLNTLGRTYESPIDVLIEKTQIIDCLELLSGNYRTPIVREMAVRRLQNANDTELAMFMVQLVQSIKNEMLVGDSEHAVSDANFGAPRMMPIAEEEMNRVEEEDNYLKITRNAGQNSGYTMGSSDYQFIEYDPVSHSDTSIVEFIDSILFKKNQKQENERSIKIKSKFINFLVERSINNSTLTNYFYWCLKVELEEERLRNKSHLPGDADTSTSSGRNGNSAFSNIYELTMKKFVISLFQSRQGKEKLYQLRRQIELVSKLHQMTLKIKIEHKKETTPRKLELLKEMLAEKHKKTIFGSAYDNRNSFIEESKYETMVDFPKLPLPLDPAIIVNGVYPEDSAVFKSSLNPLKITFKTTTGRKYPIMYKIGDDLRQDQFVTQVITLMEKDRKSVV